MLSFINAATIAGAHATSCETARAQSAFRKEALSRMSPEAREEFYAAERRREEADRIDRLTRAIEASNAKPVTVGQPSLLTALGLGMVLGIAID